MVQAKPTGYAYKICVEEHVGREWIDGPEIVSLDHAFDQDGQRAITLLLVTLPDQPALFGLLEKLRDVNLKLVYVCRETDKYPARK